jgi:alkylation response protein AidB-like acyl-CoA dehydrogenase
VERGVLEAWAGTLGAVLRLCVRQVRTAGNHRSVRAILADMRIRVEACRLLASKADPAAATLMLAESGTWMAAQAREVLGDDLPPMLAEDLRRFEMVAGPLTVLRSEIALHDFAAGPPLGRPAIRDLEESAFLEQFTRLCREKIAPRASEVSAQNWRDLVDSGYFRLFHPHELGGSEASAALLAHAMERLGAACASTLWTATISTALAGKLLHNVCRPEHHDRWLAPIIQGRLIGCFAATEHGSGCDPGAMATTVHRTADGFVLTGEKTRISNATTADVAVVLAQLESRLCYVVVDLHQRGVHRAELDKLGLRGMSWGTIRFDNVSLAEADVITDADMETVLHTVEWGQLLQTWCAVGLAGQAWEVAMSYAARRDAFGRPVAHLPIVHSRLATMRVELDAARLLAHEAMQRKLSGKPAREEVMLAKIYATEMSVRAADAAMRTLAGWAYSTNYPVERIYRDSLANIPAGLTTDRLRELLACAMLDADPWTYEPFPGLEINPAWG